MRKRNIRQVKVFDEKYTIPTMMPLPSHHQIRKSWTLSLASSNNNVWHNVCGTSAGETGTQCANSSPHCIYASWYSMPAVKGYLEFLNRINVTKLYRPGNSPELNQIENLENFQKQSWRLVYQFNSQHDLLPPRSNQKQRRSDKIRTVELFGLKWIENFVMFKFVSQIELFSQTLLVTLLF